MDLRWADISKQTSVEHPFYKQRGHLYGLEDLRHLQADVTL